MTSKESIELRSLRKRKLLSAAFYIVVIDSNAGWTNSTLSVNLMFTELRETIIAFLKLCIARELSIVYLSVDC